MGMEADVKGCGQREIEQADFEKAIANIKCGKAVSIGGITPELVKYGGIAIVV